MSIQLLSKKLRAAVNALDALLEGPGTPAIAQRILTERTTPHWTQRPENKARLRKNIKRMIAAKKAKKA